MAVVSDRCLCRLCRRWNPTVRSRGHVDLMAEMCEECWQRLANGLATVEGATAPPQDPAGNGPPRCRACRGVVRRYPTYYERWVDLATVELPAEEVPQRYRWRLIKAPAPRAPVVLAVHIRVVDPLPRDPVLPAHAFLCPAGRAADA
jgi:hypothetical protein